MLGYQQVLEKEELVLEIPQPYADHNGGTDPSDPLDLTDPTDPAYRRTEYQYIGTREVHVTQSVGTTAGAQEAFTTTNTYDGLGRLVGVESTEFGGVKATYSYDVGDSLTWVVLEDDAGTKQVRNFDYDRTGRLRSANQPESGLVEYKAYEPFGNPT